ncbi:tellurite resistance TerB family protein [Pseudomonas sp. RIT-PI-AD]|uniref:tellurite resistance TerB family protein n=1 Tax=Pseudomonas sp. RIT-PI-AD TaxID=3035294 RepID=UPI0021DADFF9|nr:tellurite resistance TerB family protein [Pseudomonas sp. RIT-PI-AD]
MNTRGLLEHLLKSGQDMMQRKASGQAGGGLGDALGDLLGGKPGAADAGGLLKGAGGSALAAGALGLLLGNKRVRALGGQAIAYGGLAALGVLAYKAYGTWQAQQADAPQGAPQTLDRVPPAEAERHSQAILKALVAAAKADGHVDAQERRLIEEELGKLTADPELRGWLERELDKPLDPADVARAATTPEMAAEVYLASLMMVDEEHFMERAYLDELARQLKLDPSLKQQLETQMRAQPEVR